MGNLHCDCFISDPQLACAKAKELLHEINFPPNCKVDIPIELRSGTYKNKFNRARNLLLKYPSLAEANYLLGVMHSYDVIEVDVPFRTDLFSNTVKPNLALKYMRIAANKGHVEAIALLPQLEKEDEERIAAKWRDKREQQRLIDIARKPYWDQVDKERNERAALVAKHPEIPVLEQIRDKQDDIKRAINNIPVYYGRY